MNGQPDWRIVILQVFDVVLENVIEDFLLEGRFTRFRRVVGCWIHGGNFGFGLWSGGRFQRAGAVGGAHGRALARRLSDPSLIGARAGVLCCHAARGRGAGWSWQMNSFLRKGTVKTIETLPGLGDVTISVDNCLADPANPLSGNAYLRCGWPMIEAIAAVEHRIGYGGIALGSALDDSQGKLGAAFDA